MIPKNLTVDSLFYPLSNGIWHNIRIQKKVLGQNRSILGGLWWPIAQAFIDQTPTLSANSIESFKSYSDLKKFSLLMGHPLYK